MLQRAIDSHQVTKAKSRPLAQQLFPSSSPASPQNASKASPYRQQQHQAQRFLNRPLATGTGNVQKQNGLLPSSRPTEATKPNTGLKRTHSGLAKVLSTAGTFEDSSFTRHHSQDNPIVIDDDSPVKNKASRSALGVYFDENDFDSDIDLEVEDLGSRASISYPSLPQTAPSVAQPVQYPVIKHTGTQTSQSLEQDPQYRGSRSGLGYLGQQQSPQISSSVPLPWSSSPSEHRISPQKAARPGDHAYPESKNFVTAASTAEESEEVPRQSKRRTLPWLADQNNVYHDDMSGRDLSRFRLGHGYERGLVQSTKTSIPESTTPLPSKLQKDEYMWNATASALKEQQKNLRLAKKKLVKTNEATEDGKRTAKEKKRKSGVSRIFLSEEQQHVLNLVVEQNKSVFFTGSAGTGKSVLLREIIASLRRKYFREPDRLAVTASTGLAACNIGGVTLHSFAGIGLGKEAAPELVKKIKKNQKARHRWMRTKVLIVDEVSMVDGELFDKLEAVARMIRNNGRPFGGIQLVITGDFFQLPPVPDSGKAASFAFDAGTWNTSIDHTIGLHKVFRQKDPVFAGMLNEMREGRLSQTSIDAFRKLDRELEFGDDITATELFPTRMEVEAANRNRMDNLRGEYMTYEARDGGTITDKNLRDKILQNCIAPEVVRLKKNAQVMLIKNMDETLVNGSLGVVLGFMSEDSFADYQHREGQPASTQEWGSHEDPNMKDLKHRGKYDSIASTAQRYPVVRFAISDGTTRDMLCHRETWKTELPNGEVQASRSQVPLILAWALSIHKAQGQTLERVKVDLGKVFEKGQAYVALSRATSMDGLQVKRFDPRKVLAHDRVRQFYASLSRAEHAAGVLE